MRLIMCVLVMAMTGDAYAQERLSETPRGAVALAATARTVARAARARAPPAHARHRDAQRDGHPGHQLVRREHELQVQVADLLALGDSPPREVPHHQIAELVDVRAVRGERVEQVHRGERMTGR